MNVGRADYSFTVGLNKYFSQEVKAEDTPKGPLQVRTSLLIEARPKTWLRLRLLNQLAYLERRSLTSKVSPESLITPPPLLLSPIPAGLPIRLLDSAELALDGILLCRNVTVGLHWLGRYGNDFISSYFNDLGELVEEGVFGPGRGEVIVDDLSRNDSAKAPFVVAPSDVRFTPPITGPATERFNAIFEGRFDEGIGIDVGVLGREVGVGKELPVVVVLKPPAERRDEGRRMPVPEDLLKVGEGGMFPRLSCPE